MKLNEFKAWFEGYTESMEGAPSKKQWERIKEQVAAVDGVAITPYSYPVYIDRYVRPFTPTYPYWVGGVGVSSATANLTGAFSGQVSNCIDGIASTGQMQNSSSFYGTCAGDQNQSESFDSVSAMYAAGKAEAAALT